MGNAVLISELVAAELATWFGLAVPPFALVDQCQIEITMRNTGVQLQPPMFFSLAVNGETHAGTAFSSRVGLPEDIAKLVVFDAWVRNTDRSQDNLLYVRRSTAGPSRYDVVPIDHGECFLGGGTVVDFPVGAWPDEEWADPETYCSFKEDFAPHLTAKTVATALTKLGQLESDFVDAVVHSVPAQWGLGPIAAGSLSEFICRRADYVVKTISTKLIEAPQLPGLANA